MRKKIALLVAGMFLMSSAALAAPMTDYTKGKASIDLNYRNTKNSVDDFSFDKKFNFEPSVTYGVADKWAIQWRNVSSKSKSTPVLLDDGTNLVPGKITSTITVNELNALYSITPEVSAFVGYVSAKGTAEVNGFKGSDKRNTWQLGLLANVPVADKVSAYGVVGVGDKWGNYEIGVSYAFTPNWDFNLDYRSLKAKDLDGVDAKAKGWGFGATYRFQ